MDDQTWDMSQMMEATEVFHESRVRWKLLDDIGAECRTERIAQRLLLMPIELMTLVTPCASRATDSANWRSKSVSTRPLR